MRSSPFRLALSAIAALFFCADANAQILTSPTPIPVVHFVDSSGNALSGGKLFSYTAGTTTKLSTYVDSTKNTTNANPTILNTRGEAQVWLPPGVAYKFVLSPSTDGDPPTNPIWTADNIVGIGSLLIAGQTSTDNKAGPVIADGFALQGASISGLSGQTIYNQAVESGNATLFQSYDSVRGVAQANASSTVNTVTGVAGYTLNNTVPIGQRTQTAALFGVGVCAVNSSNCWGIDTIVSDNPSIGNTGTSSATGVFLYNEFDVNISSPNTQGSNLRLGGTSWPTSLTLNFNALGITKLWGPGGSGTGTALYAGGIVFEDACCASGIVLGATALSGTNKQSQNIVFNYRDNAGVLQNTTLGSLGGMLFVGGTTNYGVEVPAGPNGPNAFIADQQATSGNNVASKFSLWNYFDGTGTQRNYAIQADTSGRMLFSASPATPSPKYDFEGVLSVNGTVGVTCSGAPTGSFATVNGLVTHC